MPQQSTSLIPAERIERHILLIRGQKVMLDYDLAALYEVETRILNQAVKRNLDRFPEDFMFQLNEKEARVLRSQIVILDGNDGRGKYSKYLPYAFTEQGVAMLSSVLNSPRAIQVNVEIIRAFVRLRQILAPHADLARQLAALERKYDGQFKMVLDAIRQLMTPPAPPKRRPIGFRPEPDGDEPAAKPKARISVLGLASQEHDKVKESIFASLPFREARYLFRI